MFKTFFVLFIFQMGLLFSDKLKLPECFANHHSSTPPKYPPIGCPSLSRLCPHQKINKHTCSSHMVLKCVMDWIAKYSHQTFILQLTYVPYYCVKYCLTIKHDAPVARWPAWVLHWNSIMHRPAHQNVYCLNQNMLYYVQYRQNISIYLSVF